RILNNSFRSVRALGQFLVPGAVGILILDVLRCTGTALPAGRSFGGRMSLGVSGEGFRPDVINPVGPATVMLLHFVSYRFHGLAPTAGRCRSRVRRAPVRCFGAVARSPLPASLRRSRSASTGLSPSRSDP